MRVNWTAIVVSAIVFFIFGWLWYDLLFHSLWVAEIAKVSPQGAMPRGTWYPFVVSLLMAFCLAYGLARILAWRGQMNPFRGAFIGFSMGLLIFGSMTWMNYAFFGLGATLGFINVGYVAVGMAIQGAILGNMTAPVI
jgi:Protein of unknown function (DUF1761)